MQSLRKSILAMVRFVPVLALAGCQKGGDSTQPTAAVSGPGGEKADSHAAAATEAPPVKSDQDPQHPIYEFETSQGKFIVRLDAEKAPLTVDNFRNYVARGHYDSDDLPPGAQGFAADRVGWRLHGRPEGEGPLTPIRNEAHNGLKNRRGTIAMARRANDEDSATCQFFINIADNDTLNFKSRTPEGYGYCVFGEVTEGMDVLDRIAKSPVHDTDKFVGLPVETVVIKSVRQVK